MPKSANQTHAIDDFIMGLDWSSIPTALDAKSLTVCTNFDLTRHRGLVKRKGLAKYNSSVGAAANVKSIFEYSAPNGTRYILVALSTLLRRVSTSAWNNLKTELTSGKKFSFAVHRGDCFAVNGTDDNIRIRNTTVTTVGVPVPTVAPTPVTTGDAGSFTGTYRYAYSYKRSTNSLIGNYKIHAANVTAPGTDTGFDVGVTASADSTVTNIVLYRTLDIDAGGTVGVYYTVGTYGNTTTSIEDTTTDANLGALDENDNTLPPKAYFVELHKDRMLYANCPGETDGGSLVMWSKTGEGDAVPSTNYQYFDRDDGEDITGLAVAGDYLVVFKRNKISVIEGDFREMYTIAYGVGCIAPYAIIILSDRVFFLSEEGWKVFNGADIDDVSSKVNTLGEDGYFSIDQKDDFSALHYPERNQFQCLINNDSDNRIIMVGHLVAPLIAPEDTPEWDMGKYVAWTQHAYAGHTLTTLGAYTDTNGISRPLAGSSDGYIYKMDTGYDDDGTAITAVMSTGWLDLGVPSSVTKTMRTLNIKYATRDTNTTAVAIDIDFAANVYTATLTGYATAYTGHNYTGGVYAGHEITNANLKTNGVGELFRYHITSSNAQNLIILGIITHFRVQGIR